MSNMTDLWLSGVFFQALNTPKLDFGRGSASDSAGGAYDVPQTLYLAEEGVPIPPRRLGYQAPPNANSRYTPMSGRRWRKARMVTRL